MNVIDIGALRVKYIVLRNQNQNAGRVWISNFNLSLIFNGGNPTEPVPLKYKQGLTCHQARGDNL